jgi:hypothetical protein
VRDYQSNREGLAILVLDSTDAVGDAADFARQGSGAFEPFFFERTGRRPDGTPTHVAFSLAFAKDDRLPHAAFFVCQQHYPEAFWSPLLQRHRNGATAVTSVTLDVDHPAGHRSFLQAFTGSPPSEDGRRFQFGNGGQLRLTTGSGTNRFTGFSVGVPDLEGIPFGQLADRITIDSHHGFGVAGWVRGSQDQ